MMQGVSEGSNSHAEEGDAVGQADTNDCSCQPAPLESLHKLQGQEELSALPAAVGRKTACVTCTSRQLVACTMIMRSLQQHVTAL